MKIAEILIAGLFGIIFVVLIAYKIAFRKDEINKINAQIEAKTFHKDSFEENKDLKEPRKIFKIAFCAFLLASSGVIFVTSLVLRNETKNKDYYALSINSNSMSTALEENTYIKENNLKEKIAIYDVVQVEKMNEQKDINLYDIVLYKTKDEDKYVLHRIININEDGTFETRGDFVSYSDRTDLKREEIVAKYVKKYGFASFVNYLTYTPGFYVVFTGISTVLVVDAVFDNKEKKLISNIQ